jgi:hypothetical protein
MKYVPSLFVLFGSLFTSANSYAEAEPEIRNDIEAVEEKPYWRPHASLAAGLLPLMSFQAGLTNGAHSFDYGAGIGDHASAIMLALTFEDYVFRKGSQYARYRYTTSSGIYAGLGITDYWYRDMYDSNDAGSDDPNKTCIGCAEEVGYGVYHQIGPEFSLGFTSNVAKKGFFFSIDFVSYTRPMTGYGKKKIYDDLTSDEREQINETADNWIGKQSMKSQIFSRVMVFSWGGRF